jgi:hypothetical protein
LPIGQRGLLEQGGDARLRYAKIKIFFHPHFLRREHGEQQPRTDKKRDSEKARP